MSRKRKVFAAPFLTLKSVRSKSLYRGLYESLREAILDGQLVPRAQLPSTRALALQFGVSRSTVINAYEQLIAEGYISGKTGAGTFVAANLPEDSLQARRQFSDQSHKLNLPRENHFSEYGNLLRTKVAPVMHHYQSISVKTFQHGIPAIREFPVSIWAQLSAQRWRRSSSTELLNYGNPAGYLPLRQAIATYLKASRAVNCEPEQVMIVAGAQQALDLIARLLLNSGDTVMIENPCYDGARAAFTVAGANLVGISVDAEGFNLNDAANLENKSPRLVYVTPSHQFPLGVTMSLKRRLALLEWAKRTGTWVIEDDYDSEYRYAGRPLASLQGLDQANRVIYVGTFSKTVFPALRLGCLVLPPDLVKVFNSARFITDWHSSMIDQAVLTDFIVEGHFGRHIRRTRALYHERQQILVAEVKRELSGALEVSPDDAGMHLTGWLSKGICDVEAARKAANHGVKVTPISTYSLNKTCDSGLLLGYAAFDEFQIKNGVQKLARAFSEKSI